ncbi:MAG: glycosyltransferase family 39 protein [Anaerolineales bacterium]
MRREDSFTLFLLLLAVLFGAYVRLIVPLQANFPVLDGGLFYTMIQDLLANDFRLPLYTSYNHLNIPFAYPPLPLYLAALLHLLSGVDLLEIVRWLPAVFSLLTLPAFFFLAREMLGSTSQAALATLLFALLPRSYEWLIMGGGVTRAPGMLFLLLFLWMCYRAFANGDRRATFSAALLGGLVLLSHPERALHAAVAGLLFWLWLDRSWAGAQRALVIGGGTLLVSAPWWGSVLARYGVETLAQGAQAAGERWLFWAPLLQLNFTDEMVPILAFLAVFGAFVAWKSGKGLLAIWFLLVFLTDPRSAPHVVPIQVALLAALSLSEVLFPALGNAVPNWQAIFLERRGKVFFGYFLLLLLFNAQWNVLQVQKLVLSNADREALRWIATHAPAESRFLVLDWQETLTLSPVQEWFPSLSGRMNIVTVQGREWLPGRAHFKVRMDAYEDLYACHYDRPVCLEQWADRNGETFDYVYLSMRLPSGDLQISRLADGLRASEAYRLVYETPEVWIFERLRPSP